MKKISYFFGTFVVIGLLLWAAPFLNIAIGAPIQAIDAITLTKSDGVEQVVAGDGLTHTYTIRVTNLGLSRARGVVITDTWPSAFTLGTVTATRGSCNNTSTGFTCKVENLKSGSQVTITAPYSVPPGTPAGTYTNTAEVTADGDSLPVTASDETSVVAEADVRLDSKLDDPDPVKSNETLTYTLSVTNAGPSDASGVVLIDNLPAGTEYKGSPSSPACAGSGSIVTCPLGSMVYGSNLQVVIEVLVTLSTPGTLHNTANITTTTTDPDLSNNQKDAFTDVIVDQQAPVVTWVEPVGTEKYYHANCTTDCQSVHFAVEATDDFGVQKVNFYRWDHVILDYVDIGDDFTYPYTWEFDPGILPFGINQIYARAYDYAGQMSDRKRILLIKYLETYMPILGK